MMKKAIIALENSKAVIFRSKKKDKDLKMTNYDHLRYIAIAKYLQGVVNGQGKIEASVNAANNVLVVNRKASDRQALNIREWANYYCLHGTIPDCKQGAHVKKSYTIILDKDV